MSESLINHKLISASLLRLRMRSPFFATLAMLTNFQWTKDISTAAATNQTVYLNPDFLFALPTSQQDGLILHEVLHVALLHNLRRGTREPLLWNIAADIMVNGMIMEQGHFALPEGGLRAEQLEHLCVEEIYELLLEHCPYSLPELDLIGTTLPGNSPAEQKGNAPSHGPTHTRQLKNYWRDALQKATTMAQMHQGQVPLNLKRELDTLGQGQLDWRRYLWRYLVKTPTNYSGFDRRLISRGLYLETLTGESVTVYIAIDTSGSIGPKQLAVFLGEVKGILNAYPHLESQLYYADAEVYGPYPINSNEKLPQPEGGGGTSFVPFFEQVVANPMQNEVCIYLTDGYGSFPATSPNLPVLWVVPPGGLNSEAFPFGEVVRLLAA